MKIKIVVEHDKRSSSVEIGADTLSQILHRIPCNKASKEFFGLISEFPSEKIQESIASIDNMFSDILSNLSMSDHPNVLRNLLRNENAKKHITFDQAMNCLSDNYAIDTILSSLDQFEELDRDKFLKEIISHPNPDIRLMIAESYSVPKKIKKLLLKDSDADVRATAHKNVND